MLVEDRQRRILERLRVETILSASELERYFGVTAMTVWRDLKFLEEQGFLKRIRGGAIDVQSALEQSYVEKAVNSLASKQRIAAWTVDNLINEGDIIVLDGGTTVGALTKESLPPNLTVMTNSLPIADALLRHPARPLVHLCGGLLRPESSTSVGKEALSFFRKRRATKFFMSATGVDVKAGVTDPNPLEIEVKRMMANSCEIVYLLVDAGKWGQVSLMQTLSWRRISTIVTDYKAKINKAHLLPEIQRV